MIRLADGSGVPILDRVHVVVGKAEMMACFVDHHMMDQFLQRYAGLIHLGQQWLTKQADYWRHFARFPYRAIRQRPPFVESAQLPAACDAYRFQLFAAGKLLDPEHYIRQLDSKLRRHRSQRAAGDAFEFFNRWASKLLHRYFDMGACLSGTSFRNPITLHPFAKQRFFRKWNGQPGWDVRNRKQEIRMSCEYEDDNGNSLGKPEVPEHVQNAIRTLIEWAGDDPAREGLLDTPKRVGRAWLEYCQGYQEDPAVHLSRQFEEVGGYDEVVMLKDIPFQSHCEHHLAPITGKASIAYMPRDRVVGISKLARVLHGYARRLQIQERLTAEVAQCIWDNLEPHGVAVVIEAQHGCMTGRGVRTPGVSMVTSRLLGCFLDDPRSRKEVLGLMGYG